MGTPTPGIDGHLRVYRAVWRGSWTLVTLGCAAGSFVSLGPLRFAVTVVFVAALGALYGVVLGPDLPRVRRPTLNFTLLATGAVLMLLGAPGARQGAGAVLVVLLAVTSPFVVAALDRRLTQTDPGEPDHPGGADGFDQLLRLCDDDQLLTAWYASQRRLRESTTVDETLRVAGLRQLYLDELERRAPEEFGRWLALQSLDR